MENGEVLYIINTSRSDTHCSVNRVAKVNNNKKLQKKIFLSNIHCYANILLAKASHMDVTNSKGICAPKERTREKSWHSLVVSQNQ